MPWKRQNKREQDWLWLWEFFCFVFRKEHASSVQIVEMNSEWKTPALCWAWADASASPQTVLAQGLCCAHCSYAASGFQLVYVSSSWTVGRAHHLNVFSLAKWKGDSWEDALSLLVTLKRSFCFPLVISGAFRSQNCSLRPQMYDIAHCVLAFHFQIKVTLMTQELKTWFFRWKAQRQMYGYSCQT